MTTTIKEDLAAEILRRRRRQMPRLTAALAAAVLVAVGILAGVEIQKHWGSSPATGSSAAGGNAASLRAAFASRFGGGGRFGGAGGFGGGGAGGGGATGTVTLVKGADIYVTEADGNTVLVHTSGSRVTKTVAGSVRSIHPGDAVSVNGTQAANGSWTASRITLTPAGSSNG